MVFDPNVENPNFVDEDAKRLQKEMADAGFGKGGTGRWDANDKLNYSRYMASKQSSSAPPANTQPTSTSSTPSPTSSDGSSSNPSVLQSIAKDRNRDAIKADLTKQNSPEATQARMDGALPQSSVTAQKLQDAHNNYVQMRDAKDQAIKTVQDKETALDQLGRVWKAGKLDSPAVQVMIKQNFPNYSDEEKQKLMSLIPEREKAKDLLNKQALNTPMTDDDKKKYESLSISDPSKHQNALINMGNMVLNAMYMTGKSGVGGDYNNFKGISATKDQADENKLKQDAINVKQNTVGKKSVRVDENGNVDPVNGKYLAYASPQEIAAKVQLSPIGLYPLELHGQEVAQSTDASYKRQDYATFQSKIRNDYELANKKNFETWKQPLDIATHQIEMKQELDKNVRTQMVNASNDIDKAINEHSQNIDQLDGMKQAIAQLKNASDALEKAGVKGMIGGTLASLQAKFGSDSEQGKAIAEYMQAAAGMRPYARNFAQEKGNMSNQDQAAVAQLYDVKYLDPSIRTDLLNKLDDIVNTHRSTLSQGLNRMYATQSKYQKIFNTGTAGFGSQKNDSGLPPPKKGERANGYIFDGSNWVPEKKVGK